ncbi:MAG TPA: aminomethyltransferase family protein [Blastocatellia bacterium]|nr:aminomethyltransferase family protein [Blastocatellia bacterium]
MTESVERAAQRTLLFESQKELGARFAEFFGWEMAAEFGDHLLEVQQVRKGVGLIDLSYSGAIKVGGKEGAQFLHGLVTNDVKSLAKGKGMRAAFLTGHGKVKALCRIFSLGEEYLVINDPQTHEKVFKYVFPFTYAGNFKAEDVSDQHRILSVQGPKSLLVMKEVCFEPVPDLEEYGWIPTIIAGHHVIAARTSHTGEMGYDILAPAAGLKDIWDFILLKGAFHDIVPFGQKALDHMRIEAGIPRYGIDADESNMMLELGMADAVSYNKGCYTGQEAVAMATYRGHVSKKLSGLILAGETVPAPGDKIAKDGKEIGYITSSLQSQSLASVIAMGYVKYGFFNPGTEVEILSQGQILPATVTELPFYEAVKSE